MNHTLDSINQLKQDEFTEVLGWIFEHSPWVAEKAWAHRPFTSINHLHQTMTSMVTEAAVDKQVSLIQAHPDLATKLHMSEVSTREQRGVGLDRLSPEEFARFTTCNHAYLQKFKFPFIMAVRGQTKESIIAAMEIRLTHSLDSEHEQALLEISKIAHFRLVDFIEA